MCFTLSLTIYCGGLRKAYKFQAYTRYAVPHTR